MKQEFKFKGKGGETAKVTIDPEAGVMFFGDNGVELSLARLESFFREETLRDYGHAVIDLVMAYNTLLGSYTNVEGSTEVGADMTPNPDYNTQLRELIYFLTESAL